MHDLIKGYEFPPLKYTITQDIVTKYENAVEAQNSSGKYIPPLAIAAYAMRTMSESAALPPGVIHASQEFEFIKPVNTGATLECRASIGQVIARGSMKIISIEMQALDEKQQVVLKGKATAFLPQ